MVEGRALHRLREDDERSVISPWELLLKSLWRCPRRLGCEGFAIFNYTQSFADDYLPLMALGATSRPAAIPTEARDHP